jgi:hypothetical protein
MSGVCILLKMNRLGNPQRPDTCPQTVSLGIVTTSDPPKGYIADENVYYAKQGDVDAMALAVQRHAAPRRSAASHPVRTWGAVAQEHLRLFKRLLQ